MKSEYTQFLQVTAIGGMALILAVCTIPETSVAEETGGVPANEFP